MQRTESYEAVMRLQSHMLQAACIRADFSRDPYFGAKVIELTDRISNLNDPMKNPGFIYEHTLRNGSVPGWPLSDEETAEYDAKQQALADVTRRGVVADIQAAERELEPYKTRVDEALRKARESEWDALNAEVTKILRINDANCLRIKMYLAMACGAIDGLMLGDTSSGPVVDSVRKIGRILGLPETKISALTEAVRDVNHVMARAQ